jgi:pimeloyl-ACP methyl ester carboxylesterase
MTTSEFATIAREGGTIAYTVAGDGPLVVCIPGMGDIRASYRFLAPALVEAGYRVAVVDLRGHGDSSPAFDRYDNEANAADVEALIVHLGGPAVIVGNSMGAAIGVLLAAKRPELVSGLVLIGPFVRNGELNPVTRAVMNVAIAPAFVAATWKGYYPSLNKGTRPADFDEYTREIVAAIKRPGYRRSVSKTMHTDHASAEAQLPNVHTPTLVVMGELDPDFPSPAAEAAWVGERLDGEVVMIPDAGHYPHSQRPDLVTPAIASFLARVTSRG